MTIFFFFEITTCNERCPPLYQHTFPYLARFYLPRHHSLLLVQNRRECNELLRHAHKELEAAKIQGQTSLDEAASAIALNMTLLGQVVV